MLGRARGLPSSAVVSSNQRMPGKWPFLLSGLPAGQLGGHGVTEPEVLVTGQCVKNVAEGSTPKAPPLIYKRLAA